MHKQIVEKYKYNNLSRLLAILANTVPLILGIIFLLLSEYTLLQFMGVLLIAMFSCMILSLCLFKCLLIYENKVVIEWFLLNKDEIQKKDLNASLYIHKHYFGTLLLRDKNKKKCFLFMGLSLFGLGYQSLAENRKEVLKNLELGVEND
jgi:hypothetical protein